MWGRIFLHSFLMPLLGCWFRIVSRRSFNDATGLSSSAEGFKYLYGILLSTFTNLRIARRTLTIAAENRGKYEGSSERFKNSVIFTSYREIIFLLVWMVHEHVLVCSVPCFRLGFTTWTLPEGIIGWFYSGLEFSTSSDLISGVITSLINLWFHRTSRFSLTLS